MKLHLNDIVDKHKNITALIMGHGPSLNNELEKAYTYMEENPASLQFSCNDWFTHIETKPNYWVLASGSESITVHHRKMNEVGATVLYARNIDLTPYSFIDANLSCDFLGYDQRHFNTQPCPAHGSRQIYKNGMSCCSRIDKNQLCIQEQVQKLSNYPEHYSSGDSVSLHMIAAAIIMGCNPIYLLGMDMSYTRGGDLYAKALKPGTIITNKQGSPDVGGLDNARPRVKKDFDILQGSAQNLNIQIINTTKDPWYSSFELGSLHEK